jgi:hypothetical protein
MKKPERRLYYKTSTPEERREMITQFQVMGYPINEAAIRELVNNRYGYEAFPMITWEPIDEEFTLWDVTSWDVTSNPDILVSKREFLGFFGMDKCVTVNENGNFKHIFK